MEQKETRNKKKITLFSAKYLSELLIDIDNKGYRPLTSLEIICAKVKNPENDVLWKSSYAASALYYIKDWEGKFGEKESKICVVAHGYGPLLCSEKISKIERKLHDASLERCKNSSDKFQQLRETGIIKNAPSELTKEEQIELVNPEAPTEMYTLDRFSYLSRSRELDPSKSFGIVIPKIVPESTEIINGLSINPLFLSFFGKKEQHERYIEILKERKSEESKGDFRQNGLLILNRFVKYQYTVGFIINAFPIQMLCVKK
jgi:hypothetical protein